MHINSDETIHNDCMRNADSNVHRLNMSSNCYSAADLKKGAKCNGIFRNTMTMNVLPIVILYACEQFVQVNGSRPDTQATISIKWSLFTTKLDNCSRTVQYPTVLSTAW